MKFTLSIFVGILLVFATNNTVVAQNNDKEASSMKTIEAEKTSYHHTFEVDSAKLATKITTENSATENVKDVAYYNEFIKALEVKREYVLNDPTEKAIAEESGWFEQIDSEIAKAKAEREILLQK